MAYDLTWYKSMINKIIHEDMKNSNNQYDILQLLLNMTADLDFENEEVKDYAMSISKYTHQMADYMAFQTGKRDFDDIYWKLLHFEAPYLFESFLYYMEKNRNPNKRFYLPRKKTLNVVVQDLQDLEDRKIEFLGLSEPPRVGKLVSDETPVLTKDGWKEHGELEVGDFVISPDGEFVRVNHVFPKGVANIRVHFSDGSHVDVHENHEWLVYNKHKQKEEIVETKSMFSDFKNKEDEYFYLLPLKKPIVANMDNWGFEERIRSLVSLLDWKGRFLKEECCYIFSTEDEIIKDCCVILVSTFGWTCFVTKKDEPTGWEVRFNPTFCIPCNSIGRLESFKEQTRVAFSGFERIEPVQGNCISVDGGMYCVGESLIPTHNSTICIFFLAWIMGKRPNSHNAMSGHSGILADGFYSEILNLIATPEYTFNEIFPNARLERKSGEKKEINLDKPDRFATLTCRGIDGTWTGAVDISYDGYLYVDDMVRDRTESLNPNRLEGRFQDYLNVLVDRKNDGSRELMVGTRWNVLDPLGRMEKLYKDNPMYRFRKIPALNDDGESNFKYDNNVGFSTEYFLKVKEKLDNNEWMAKYQQKPYVREGILFAEDDLRYFNGVLPEGGLVGNVSACDVAWGGGDSLSMPVGALYENGDVYIYDWVFSGERKERTLPTVSAKIMSNKIQKINFEANNGGDMYADKISEILKSEGYACSVTYTKAPNTMAKATKIQQYADDIIKNFIFLDEKHRSKEYQKAMEEFTTYVIIGKNEHDDAADGITQLAMSLGARRFATVETTHNPFWG